MKTAQAASRPRIQNRAVAERRAPRTSAHARLAHRQNVVTRPRKKTRKAAAPLPNGLDVMSLLIGACVLVAAMLVVSLNWQRNAYALSQQEVDLRSALDQTSDERQQALTEQRRALNPRETAARSANAGLNEFKLDERTASAPAKPKASPSPTAATNKPNPKTASVNTAKSTR